VGGAGLGVVAGHLQQVRSHRLEAMVSGQPAVDVQGVQHLEWQRHAGPFAAARAPLGHRGSLAPAEVDGEVIP
jgi:hypothetical protein